MQAVGSVMTNKYSEGYPGARYYGGNEYCDNSPLFLCNFGLITVGLGLMLSGQSFDFSGILTWRKLCVRNEL